MEVKYLTGAVACDMLRKKKRGGFVKNLVDMHVHSQNSHDAHVPVLDMARSSVNAGIRMLAIADHWDGLLCPDGKDQDLFSHIQHCYVEVKAAQAALGHDCELLVSIELGEPHWDYEMSAKALKLVPYDAVIGSVHAVRCPEAEGKIGLDRAYSRMDFANISEENLDRFFRLYFDETLSMVKTVDIDILAHLGSPKILVLRKQGRELDLHRYSEQIDEILNVLIEKGIALEFNSAELDTDGLFAPDPWVVKRYLELGGKKITLASDAHFLHETGRGMEKAVSVLREFGVQELCFLKNREFNT